MINGAKMWTSVQGEGTPILLCHGGPGGPDYLGPVAGMVDDFMQVLRYEQRGCGRSEKAPPYDLDTYIEDIEGIRRHYEVGQWLVGGHSWGADLALAYALVHRDKVLGLVYLSGTGIQHDVDWTAAKEKGLTERGETRPQFTAPFNEFVHETLRTSWYEFIKTPSLQKRITQLDAPALFVHGSLDVRRVWPVEQLASLMPDARLEIIEAEHFLWLTQPIELRRLLREFLTQLSSHPQRS